MADQHTGVAAAERLLYSSEFSMGMGRNYACSFGVVIVVGDSWSQQQGGFKAAAQRMILAAGEVRGRTCTVPPLAGCSCSGKHPPQQWHYRRTRPHSGMACDLVQHDHGGARGAGRSNHHARSLSYAGRVGFPRRRRHLAWRSRSGSWPGWS